MHLKCRSRPSGRLGGRAASGHIPETGRGYEKQLFCPRLPVDPDNNGAELDCRTTKRTAQERICLTDVTKFFFSWANSDTEGGDFDGQEEDRDSELESAPAPRSAK